MLIKLLEGLESKYLAGPPRKPLRIRLVHWSVRRASIFAILRKVGIQEGAAGTMSRKLAEI